MLRFETKRYLCSSFIKDTIFPSLSCHLEPQTLKSAITDFEGLFVGYGWRETAYPYPEQNLYTGEQEQDVRVAVLENEFLYAEFLVDFGARLWKLYDKKKQKDILYTNDVIRLRNLSIRNAWFSGGVEWNCGVIGHSPFTCSTMYCAEVEGENGVSVLRFYEFERVREIYYQMDFWLENDRLMVAVRIENPNEEVVPMYWWSNMATPEYENGRVAVPAQSAYNNSDGMGIKKSQIPYDNGVDVSYPAQIPDTIDYFYDIPACANKFIANVDAHGQGLLQFSSHRLKGRKLFSWGHRKGSAHWQAMLTKQAGDYVEIQAGLGKTQYECVPMPPKTSWSFLECYTLADVGSIAVQGSYEELVSAVNRQVEGILSSDQMDAKCKKAETDISLQKGRLVYPGSGFGYLQNAVLNNAPAHLEFLPDAQVQAWLSFANTGKFEKYVTSFASGKAAKMILKDKQCSLDWQATYQAALIEYDKRHFDAAERLCKKSLILDHNAWNCHLYAFILYQTHRKEFAYYALKAVSHNKESYTLCENVLRLLLTAGAYEEAIACAGTVADAIYANPRIQMYLSKAYLEAGDTDKAECILMKDGGLELLDFREGDRFLDNLYRRIRSVKYHEDEKAITVPIKFDFIVSKQVWEEGD